MTDMKTSKELKEIARDTLFGNYKIFILSYCIITFITSTILNLVEKQTGVLSLIYTVSNIIIVILSGVFSVGQYFMYRKAIRGTKPLLNDMWIGFRSHADKAIIVQAIQFGMYLVASLPFGFAFILFVSTKSISLVLAIALTAIIFIFVSIYIQTTYGLALFLVIDYPDESPMELLKHSARMMQGHKFQLFYMFVSFIGVAFLAILSLGVGSLWVYPYFTCTYTLFYEELYSREKAVHIDISVDDSIQ